MDAFAAADKPRESRLTTAADEELMDVAHRPPPSLWILTFRKRESDGEGFGGQSIERGLLLGEAAFDELTFQLR